MSTLSDLQAARHEIEGFSWTLLLGTSGLAIAIGDALAPPAPEGSPDAIGQVAEYYRLASGTCASTAGDLKRVAGGSLPAAWKGDVAETAAQAVSALSSEVTHMQDTLHAAAQALDSWAAALRSAQRRDAEGVSALKKAQGDIGWGGIDVFGAQSAQREATEGVEARVAAAQQVQDAATHATSTLHELASRARAERILTGDVDALGSVELAATGNPGGAPGIDGGPILTDTQLSRGSQQLDRMSPADRAAFERMLAQSASPQESAYLWKALAAGHSISDLTSFRAAIHPHGNDPVWLAEHLTPAITSTDSAGNPNAQQATAYKGVNSFDGYDAYSQGGVNDCVAASTVVAQLSMDPTLMLKTTTGGTADGDDSPEAFHRRLDALYVSEYQRGQRADGQSAYPANDNGLGPDGETALAGSDLGKVDGSTYTFTRLNNDDDRSHALDGIEQAVDSGKPVPIDAVSTDGTSAHQMMIIGRDGDRLEIYNPWGFTEWVSESDFVNGRIGDLTTSPQSPTGGEHTVYGAEIPQ